MTKKLIPTDKRSSGYKRALRAIVEEGSQLRGLAGKARDGCDRDEAASDNRLQRRGKAEPVEKE